MNLTKTTKAIDLTKAVCFAPTKFLFRLNGRMYSYITNETIQDSQNKSSSLMNFFKMVISIVLFIPGFILGLCLFGALMSCSKKYRALYYKEPLEPHLRCKGSQAECYGDVDLTIAQEALTKITTLSPPGIQFDNKPLEPYWRGGTCCAMSYHFAHKYLSFTEKCGPLAAVKLTATSPEYATSSKYFRSTQQAFSKFFLNKEPTGDIGKNKIQAMMNYYGRKVVYASDIISLESIKTPNPTPSRLTIAEKAFAKELKKRVKLLPDGVFLVNQWIPNANVPKGQMKGHVMVYIRTKGKEFYYDPNKGTHELGNSHPKKRSLFRCIANPCQMFQKTHMQFYQIV